MTAYTDAMRAYAQRYLGHPMTDKMIALCDAFDAEREETRNQLREIRKLREALGHIDELTVADADLALGIAHRALEDLR